MASVYLGNIRQAFLVFPFIAFLITIPFLIHNYHKYGSIPFMRWLAVYLFAFYPSARVPRLTNGSGVDEWR